MFTDLKISGWTDNPEGQRMRTLTYVMHMVSLRSRCFNCAAAPLGKDLCVDCS